MKGGEEPPFDAKQIAKQRLEFGNKQQVSIAYNLNKQAVMLNYYV